MALKPRCAGLETGGWRTASKRFKPSQRSRWPAACSRLVRLWSSSSRARAGFRTPLKRGCRGRHPEILSLYNTGEARMNQRRSSAIEALRAELLKRIKAGVEYIRLLQKECAVADRPLKFGFVFIVFVLLVIIILSLFRRGTLWRFNSGVIPHNTE